MAHKTLIDGTAYEVKGGKTLVAGTAYSIQKGRTLVDGTGYDVLFGSSVAQVLIFGTGSSNRGYVTVNDTKYTEGDAAIEVNAGDSITFMVGADDSAKTGSVIINGETYISHSDGSIHRSWTVPDDCRFIRIVLNTTEYEDEDDGSTNVYCTIDVTTFNTTPFYATITGSGSSTYCHATINGTKYYSAKSDIPVWAGDTITFGVRGRSATYYGEVVIDGSQVLVVTSTTTSIYEWTVPSGITSISIAMSYTSTTNQRNGRITVTTT